MALQKAYNKFGQEFSSAYHRVKRLDITNKEDCMVFVEIYKDADAADRNDPEQPIDLIKYHVINIPNQADNYDEYFSSIQRENEDSFRLAYDYLKEQVEYYEDAIDV